MKTLLIIFGSTGDLAKRKLFPALYNIYTNASKKNIDIISVGRRDFSDNDFKEYITKASDEFIENKDAFDAFLSNIYYAKVELQNSDDYKNLDKKIQSLSDADTQIIIYLSISTDFFVPFIDNSKYLTLDTTSKVIFEKPFGSNLETAITLNNKICEVFLEEQIYRIDHYVGKESIQNIIAFRFANSIFEPIWNNKYIDNIQITASEKIGIENRGGYYDTSGALKDMIQNHLLQILSFILMDAPLQINAHNVHSEKYKVLLDIKPIEDFEKNIVFGQYIGYKDEPGVSKESRSETFVAMKIEVDNARMAGVPIYLKTGKYLDTKSTNVVIEFKKLPSSLFEDLGYIENNRIILEFQPNEGISIHFNIKENGDFNNVQRVRSVFRKEIIGKEAYEKLLEDVIIGDKTLFTPFEFLKKSWEIINNLTECKDNCPMLYPYEKNSKGPKEADNLILNDKRKWYIQ